MKDEDPLEASLRSLRPTALPPSLLDRLLAVEPPPVRHRTLRRLRFAVPLGALAAVGLAALLFTGHRLFPRGTPSPAPAVSVAAAAPQPSDFRVFLPADRRSTLLNVSEGAVVDAGPERQIRLVRAVWLDDTTYIGDDHSTFHRQTARTEIIPVDLENF